MISRVRRAVAGLPILGALAATQGSSRTAQPLSAEPAGTKLPGSGLDAPYRHVGWCGFCGFDPCRCQTSGRARTAGVF